MALQPDDQPPLTGREQAIAQAVATLLRPLLTQLDHKLDALSAQLEAILAQLGVMATPTGAASAPHPQHSPTTGTNGDIGR